MDILPKQSLRKHGNIPRPDNLNRIRKASKKIRQRRARYGSEEHTSTDCDNRHYNNLALISQERTSHGDKKCAQERAHRKHLLTSACKKATSDFKKFETIGRSTRHWFFFAPIILNKWLRVFKFRCSHSTSTEGKTLNATLAQFACARPNAKASSQVCSATAKQSNTEASNRSNFSFKRIGGYYDRLN